MLIFVTILQLLAALILIAIVLFQSGKSQGLSGTIGGIADSYMAKSKAKSLDAKLATLVECGYGGRGVQLSERARRQFDMFLLVDQIDRGDHDA